MNSIRVDVETPVYWQTRAQRGLPPRNQLEAVRNSLGMAQEEFAQKLGISRQLVNNYESGQAFPSVRTWMKMKIHAQRHHIVLPQAFIEEHFHKKIKEYAYEVPVFEQAESTVQ